MTGDERVAAGVSSADAIEALPDRLAQQRHIRRTADIGPRHRAPDYICLRGVRLQPDHWLFVSQGLHRIHASRAARWHVRRNDGDHEHGRGHQNQRHDIRRLIAARERLGQQLAGANAAQQPEQQPDGRQPQPLAITIRSTWLRSAPSAMRTPIPFVRRFAAYATRP